MIKVIKIELLPSKRRIGTVIVRYYDLVLACDLCVYKSENLWVRMPEYWENPELKVHCVSWDDPNISDAFQQIVLKAALEMEGLTLEKGIEIRSNFLKGMVKSRINHDKIKKVERKRPPLIPFKKPYQPANILKGFKEIPLPKDDNFRKRLR